MTAESQSPLTPARRSVSSTVTAALLALAVLAGAPCVVAALLAGGRAFARFDPLHSARLDPVSALPGESRQTIRVARADLRPVRVSAPRSTAAPSRDWSRVRLCAVPAPTRAPALGAAWGAREALLSLPPPTRAA